MQPNGSSAFPHMAFLASVFVIFGVCTVQAQTSSSQAVTLVGNHPAEVASLRPMAHANSAAQLSMQVTLGLRNRGELDQLLRDQQDPASPSYHRWLTPAQFTARFGPSQQDLDAVAQWLGAQGLKITATSLAQRYLRFSGAVTDAERAFGTNIMVFGDGTAYSNITDPVIPARLGGVISAIGGLDNFLHSMAVSNSPVSPQPAAAASGWSAGSLELLDSGPALPVSGRGAIAPAPDVTIGGVTAFGPADFYSFYDEDSLISGGDCIAIVGDSDYLASAVTTFNSTFGLPASSITTVLADTVNPGFNSDETEALLDLEWSHAVASGTATRFYLGNNNTASANGSIVDAIQKAVTDNTCGVISVSFDLCGASPSFYTGTVSPIYAQAASQGQSIFVSSGDEGAAGLVFNSIQNQCVAATSRNVNELGADPNVTSVGGTEFIPNFDANGNNVGNVPESAWNDGSGASGGGASAVYVKPSYQSGTGVPADGRRDVPDVALIASPNSPGTFMAYDQSCGPMGNTCTGAGPVGFVVIGGTSLSAQAWAGISKLIAQIMGSRPGPLNPRIYALAKAGLAASGFRDVTTGNNNFNGVAGFSADVGFDLTTGWGTVDIKTFAHAYAAGATPSPTPTSRPTPTPTATPTPAASAAPSPSPTAPPAPLPQGTSHSSGSGSTTWLVFFTLALGWSLFQLLRNALLRLWMRRSE